MLTRLWILLRLCSFLMIVYVRVFLLILTTHLVLIGLFVSIPFLVLFPSSNREPLIVGLESWFMRVHRKRVGLFVDTCILQYEVSEGWRSLLF